MLLLAVALALPMLVAPEEVLAQPSKRERAITHYNQAEAYFKTKSFDKAAEEYEKAYALAPQPGLLFNIALAHENRGAVDEAISAYARYLKAAANGKKAPEARARLEALRRTRDQAQATRVEIEAHRTRANELLASGKHIDAIAELQALHKLQPAPGLLFEIAVAYESAGEAELAVAQYSRYLESNDSVHAADAAARRRALSEKEKADSGRGASRVGQEQDAARTGSLTRPSPVLPMVSSGITVALLGTGIAFGLRANSLETELSDEHLAADPPVDNSDPRFSQGRSAATVATSLFVVSAVAGAASAYLWWRYLRRPSAERSARAYLVPTTNGVALGGSF